MQPVFYRGVPYGNLQKANRLTIPGSLVDVSRFRNDRAVAEGDALAAVRTAITRYTQDASKNPYHVALATDIYNVKLGNPGLGDGFLSSSDAKFGQNAVVTGEAQSSGWFDVAKVFVDNLSQGIACKIGGGCKSSTPGLPAPPVSSLPSWVPLAAIGVGGFLLLNVLRKRA